MVGIFIGSVLLLIAYQFTGVETNWIGALFWGLPGLFFLWGGIQGIRDGDDHIDNVQR